MIQDDERRSSRPTQPLCWRRWQLLDGCRGAVATCQSRDVGKSASHAVVAAADLGIGPLAAVLERSRDGIVVVTADRRYLYANPAACSIMGYSLEKLRAT